MFYPDALNLPDYGPLYTEGIHNGIILPLIDLLLSWLVEYTDHHQNFIDEAGLRINKLVEVINDTVIVPGLGSTPRPSAFYPLLVSFYDDVKGLYILKKQPHSMTMPVQQLEGIHKLLSSLKQTLGQ